MTTLNTRYLAYCAAHRNTPEQQHSQDKERYPGGVMVGFSLWIMAMWEEFEVQTNTVKKFRTTEQHHAFDAWLQSKVTP